MPRSNKFLSFMVASRLFQEPKNSQKDQTSVPLAQINDDGGEEVEIIMHDAIGDDWVGLDSHTVVTKIKQAKGRRLTFDINSFGGSAYDGIAIYNAAAQHDAEVTAKITGIGYSAASIIPMAADRILIAENGSLGIHPAWMFAVGNRFAMLDNAKWLETLDGQIIDTYAARTGRKKSEIEDWFIGGNNDGTVLSGKQAVEYGFADELIPLKTKGKSSDKDDKGTKNDISERFQQFEARHRAAVRRELLAEMAKSLK